MKNRCRSLPFWGIIVLAASVPAHSQDKAGAPAAAPADPNYIALREAAPTQSFGVSGLSIERDAGKFEFKSGTITFLTPVLDRVSMAVFSGGGVFSLEPAAGLEKSHMKLLFNQDIVAEPFREAVLVFTDDTYSQVKEAAQQQPSVDAQAAEILKRFRGKMRSRRENPRSITEARLAGNEIDNIEAELLTELYNPARGKSFVAYIRGGDHEDLRYIVRPRGALHQMLTPEEVALVHLNPGNEAEGIWYLTHLKEELSSGTASSAEDRRTVDAESYRISTTIEGNKNIAASCEFTFSAIEGGDQVLRMDLLPTLRVQSVELAGEPIAFIQEDKKSDSSFYVVFPAPLEKEKQYTVTISYRGDEVIESEGGGSFAVGARSSWYPNVNSFADRATFELEFNYPKRNTLVSVGKLVEENKKGKNAYSKWKSDVPLTVAGFNYGLFKKKDITDERTKALIEGYATSQVPDFLRGSMMADLPIQGASRSTMQPTAMTPTRMMENAMTEAQASMQLFTHYFGDAPYGRIAITQQPSISYGQSWPSLVYLPVTAFLDSTQRWMMMGNAAFKYGHFIQEVTPHEVAHQWWGHAVGWKTYHDQWISEGFSDFSAGLFIEVVRRSPAEFLQFIQRWRDAILQKNEFGFSANDVGPLWMGQRLSTNRTPGAYSRLIYPKGGYVLHMLRSIMYDRQEGDKRFIEMMRDFVRTHYHENATTEDFQRIVEKHMTPRMDLEGNKRMNWFFRQWVYGTEIPSYKLEYKLEPQSGGQVKLTGKVSQSGVSDGFAMIVPIYLDFDGNVMRLGEAQVTGSTSTPPFEVMLPKQPKRVLLNARHDILANEVLSVTMP